MQKGSIAQMGVPEVLYAKPSIAYVADFIGSANLLAVQFVAHGTVRLGDYTLTVDTSSIADTKTLCKLVLRPEAISINSKSFLEGSNTLPVKVVHRQYLGAKTSYRVSLMESNFVLVDSSYSPAFEIGQEVFLHIPHTSRLISA
jgi:iron(III) transport system ATP-binding protein